MQSESFLPLKSPKFQFWNSGSRSGSSTGQRTAARGQECLPSHPVSWSSPSLPPSFATHIMSSTTKHDRSGPLSSRSLPHSLGSGATVVRTPADALEGSMDLHCNRSVDLSNASIPAKIPSTSTDRSASRPMDASERPNGNVAGTSMRKSLAVSLKTSPVSKGMDKLLSPPGSSPRTAATPFSALLLAHTKQPLPPQPCTPDTTSTNSLIEDKILITLELAYESPSAVTSFSDEASASCRIVLPLECFRQRGKASRLLAFIEGCLLCSGPADDVQRSAMRPHPELTDDESVYSGDGSSLHEEGDQQSQQDTDGLIDRFAELDALISEETLFSEAVESSPYLLSTKPLPLLPCEQVLTAKKLAHIRNQQNFFPTPSSSLISRQVAQCCPTPPLALRSRLPQLSLKPTTSRSPVRGATQAMSSEGIARRRGTLTELRILLLRPSGPYQAIAAYLLHGALPAELSVGCACVGTNAKSPTTKGESCSLHEGVRQRRLVEVENEAEWLGLTDVSRAAKRLMSLRSEALLIESRQSGCRRKSGNTRVGPGWI